MLRKWVLDKGNLLIWIRISSHYTSCSRTVVNHRGSTRRGWQHEREGKKTDWHFTSFHPCPIMHQGTLLAFCLLFFPRFHQCRWRRSTPRPQYCKLSLRVSEFINTHLIGQPLRRDFNHLHTEIGFSLPFLLGVEEASPRACIIINDKERR